MNCLERLKNGCLGGLGFWILLLSACSITGPSGPAVAPADILRVGVAPHFPPMVFKMNGRLQGLEVDLANGFAADIGKTAEFVELSSDGLIDALLSGKIDIIMSGMSITPARQARVDFCRPYMSSGQLALVRREEADAVRMFMGAERYKIGVQRNTTGDFYVERTFLKTKRVVYSSPTAGAQALANKKISVFMHDAPVIWWLASKFEGKGIGVLPNYFTEEYLAWGVRKGDQQLRQQANDYLSRSNESGQLTQIIRRWVPNI